MHLHPDYAFLDHYRKIQAQYIVPSKPAPAPVPEAGIKPITRYETPDGEVHDSEAWAEIHLRYLVMRAELVDMNIDWKHDASPEHLAKYLAANGYELRKIAAP